VHRKLGGDPARTADPTDQRDIPCHMMSCSAHKAGGRRRKGGDTGVMVFVFPSKRWRVMKPCFPGDG